MTASLVLENEALQVTVDPSLGGTITEIRHKALDVSVLGTVPWAPKPGPAATIAASDETQWLQHYTGGGPLLFPNGGDACLFEGVTHGFAKTLEIQGVGYRAAVQGKNLELTLGYSHPVPVPAPDGIEFDVPQPTKVIVRGISKQLVGETAAYIRKLRPPEPYKGKGIRYEGEYVARKVGKRA